VWCGRDALCFASISISKGLVPTKFERWLALLRFSGIEYRSANIFVFEKRIIGDERAATLTLRSLRGMDQQTRVRIVSSPAHGIPTALDAADIDAIVPHPRNAQRIAEYERRTFNSALPNRRIHYTHRQNCDQIVFAGPTPRKGHHGIKTVLE
jgi:hypothetical protein